MLNRKHKKTEDGFTLMEVLLSVMLFGGIMLAVFQVLNDVAQKEAARTTSKYMAAVADAVQNTLTSDLTVFEAFYADLQTAALCGAPSWICAVDYDINNADPAIFDFANGGTVAAVAIPPSSRLNANFRATNPLHSNITIIMAIADDPAVNTDIPAITFLVAASDRSPDKITREAALESGPNGGTFRSTAALGAIAAGDMINSSFGTWSIDATEFSGTTWFATASGATPNRDDGIYLIQRGYVNFQDTSGDYLYRQQQANPELHVMLANLNLGGNNIIGADNIVVQNELTANNQLIVKGDARLLGNLDVDGSLFANGAVTMDNVTFQHDAAALRNSIAGASFLDSGGNPDANRFTTLGNVNVGTLTMNANGDLSADTASLRTVSAQDIDATFNGGGDRSVDAFSDVEINGTVNATSLSVSGSTTTTVNGALNATAPDFQNSNLTINGDAGLLQMDTNANVNVSGRTTVPVYSAINLNVNNFGVCEQGCGE